jgi:hypothetical protein
MEPFTFLDRSEMNGDRIGVCEYRYYPFFGSHRQHNVCRPLWIPEFPHFLEYVQRHELSVVIARHNDPFPQKRYERVKGWLDEHVDMFQPLRDDHRYLMVRVDRARLNTTLASLNLAQRGP